MEKLTISLPVNAWNAILLALSQLPYAEVADLIAEIKKQGESQKATTTNSAETEN